MAQTEEQARRSTAALVMVGGLADRIQADTETLREFVAIAKHEGAPWRMIGVALGVSTQAAWERFRDPVPERPIAGQGGLFDAVPELEELRADGT